MVTSSPWRAVQKKERVLEQHIHQFSQCLHSIRTAFSSPYLLCGFQVKYNEGTNQVCTGMIKLRSILIHDIKFQDQSSKWYHYIKAYTYVFNGAVQWFPSCGSQRYFQNTYRSAKYSLHTEYYLT